MKLSSLAMSINPSPTLALSALAASMKAQGKDIISLSAGELDIAPAELINNAAKKAIDEAKIRYTASAGLPLLRKTIAEKTSRKHNIALTMKNVVVTSGAKQAISNAILALLEPGEEVIFPAPYWVSYPEMVTLARGKSVIIPTTSETNFKLTPELLMNYISAKSKILILNSPSNPTGMLYSFSEIEALVEIARKANFTIISDEIYDCLVFDGKHTSLLDFGNEILDHAVVINGVSKTYAMTGWRLGWAIGNEEIISAMDNIQAHQTSNACTISQYATIAALEKADEFIEHLVPLMAKRKDTAIALFSKIQGIVPIIPQGAFYIFCDVRNKLTEKYFPSSQALAKYLLEEALVATVPGEDFGMPGFLRISITASEETIAEAASRIERALQKL